MKVADLITSVAEQTNLLALNAAIEAARAGEQGERLCCGSGSGKRELSAKSSHSAIEIRSLYWIAVKWKWNMDVAIIETTAN